MYSNRDHPKTPSTTISPIYSGVSHLPIARLGLALPKSTSNNPIDSLCLYAAIILPRCHSTASIDPILSSLASFSVARSTASLAYAVSHRGCDFWTRGPPRNPHTPVICNLRVLTRSTDHPDFLGSPPRIDRLSFWITLAQHLHPSHQRSSSLLLNTVDALSTPASDSTRLRQGAIDSALSLRTRGPFVPAVPDLLLHLHDITIDVIEPSSCGLSS